MLPFRAALGIFVVVAAAGLAQPAWTQTYPTQNITLQVAFAAGGIADVVARLVGQKLSERFGQAVVVENRGGAGGNLAAKSVSGAAPDGYTILATTTSLAVNEAVEWASTVVRWRPLCLKISVRRQLFALPFGSLTSNMVHCLPRARLGVALGVLEACGAFREKG